ncbi:hypothetical protein ACE400_30170, partial [Salmonella enterica]|uniref:hypothetical protein n=1 Tax=Salmonella enterica TaxID=28901 RepID=UPI003D2BB97F
MVGIDNQYLLLGGESGNIWAYDGRVISGPVFTTKSNTGQSLPVNILFTTQFAHESEPYIYAGTGIVPRL